MVHFPSLLVGSTFSLVSFLAIHEQLSHRSRLSSKWKLTGTNDVEVDLVVSGCCRPFLS
jgi:hypothetical protein